MQPNKHIFTLGLFLCYFCSEAILSLSNMAVLKQEAPSPPNDYRQQAHSPNNQHSMNQENSNGDQGTNAMLNATIQQLLSHSGFNSTPNAIEGNLWTNH